MKKIIVTLLFISTLCFAKDYEKSTHTSFGDVSFSDDDESTFSLKIPTQEEISQRIDELTLSEKKEHELVNSWSALQNSRNLRNLLTLKRMVEECHYLNGIQNSGKSKDSSNPCKELTAFYLSMVNAFNAQQNNATE